MCYKKSDMSYAEQRSWSHLWFSEVTVHRNMVFLCKPLHLVYLRGSELNNWSVSVFRTSNKDIQSLLANVHRYIVSERYLKWIRKSCNLFRRKGYTHLDHRSLMTSLGIFLWLLRKINTSSSSLAAIVTIRPCGFSCAPDIISGAQHIFLFCPFGAP